MIRNTTTPPSKISMLFTLAAACNTKLTPARLNKAKDTSFSPCAQGV